MYYCHPTSHSTAHSPNNKSLQPFYNQFYNHSTAHFILPSYISFYWSFFKQSYNNSTAYFTVIQYCIGSFYCHSTISQSFYKQPLYSLFYFLTLLQTISQRSFYNFTTNLLLILQPSFPFILPLPSFPLLSFFVFQHI